MRVTVSIQGQYLQYISEGRRCMPGTAVATVSSGLRESSVPETGVYGSSSHGPQNPEQVVDSWCMCHALCLQGLGLAELEEVSAEVRDHALNPKP